MDVSILLSILKKYFKIIIINYSNYQLYIIYYFTYISYIKITFSSVFNRNIRISFNINTFMEHSDI